MKSSTFPAPHPTLVEQWCADQDPETQTPVVATVLYALGTSLLIGGLWLVVFGIAAQTTEDLGTGLLSIAVAPFSIGFGYALETLHRIDVHLLKSSGTGR